MFDGTGRKINLFVRDFLQRGVRRGAELSCAKAEKMLLILTSWNLDTRASWKHLRSLDWIRYIRLPCIACRFPFQYVPVHPSVLQVFKLWFGMIWPCALWFSPVLWKGTYGILWPESVLHLTDSAEQLGIAASGFKSRSSCHFDPSRREKAWSHCEDEDSRHFQSSNSPLNISQHLSTQSFNDFKVWNTLFQAHQAQDRKWLWKSDDPDRRCLHHIACQRSSTRLELDGITLFHSSS